MWISKKDYEYLLKKIEMVEGGSIYLSQTMDKLVDALGYEYKPETTEPAKFVKKTLTRKTSGK